MNRALRKKIAQALASRESAILDASGKPFFAAGLDTAHRGASRTDPAMVSWTPPTLSADAAILPELSDLTDRDADLKRNHGIVAGDAQTMVDNVVGAQGLRLNAAPGYEALGWTADQAHQWSRQVEREFRLWAENSDCDLERTLVFAGLTELGFRSAMRSDLLCLPHYKQNRGARYALCLQMVSPDRLSNPEHKPNSSNLRGGVELVGLEPRAYHIRTAHPGDAVLPGAWAASPGKWKRIPARTPWGRRRVIHAFHKTEVGQHRGVPITTAVMGHLRMLDKFESTELQSSIVTAMIALIVESSMDQEDFESFLGVDNAEEEAQAFMQSLQAPRAPLRPGMVYPLRPGESAKSHMPNRPGGAFAPFVEAMYRRIAAGLNIPYELLLKDFTKTNYSSARAALLEAWRFFMGRRAWLAAYWCQPVYELWMEEAAYKGTIGITPAEFYANKQALTAAQWLGPGKGWVDPVKEAQGAALRDAKGYSNLGIECAEQGIDWERNLEQKAQIIKRIREIEAEYGLPNGSLVQDNSETAAAMAVKPRSDMEKDTAAA